MAEVLQEINWSIIAPIIVLELVLMLIALVDWIRNKETNGPRMLWLFVILLIQIVGPVLYFVIGRKQG